jgi:hypothetical protein
MSGSEPKTEGEDFMLAQPIEALDPAVGSAKSMTVEEQLAHVIEAAREVAVVAEELLREFVAQDAARKGEGQATPHAVVLAPRLLSATQQQLNSLLAMMRTI